MAIFDVTNFDPEGSFEAAIRSASDGDEVRVHGMIKLSEGVTCSKHINLSGVGPDAALVASRAPMRSRGILVTTATTSIRNIRFEGAGNLAGNAAGVWHQRGDLMLDGCEFLGNQNGVMVASEPSDTLTVSSCRFSANGGGCGHTHGLYVTSDLRSVLVRQSIFVDTHMGHHLKCRARSTRVEKSYFGSTGLKMTSSEIDLPNGGDAEICHNQLIKGSSAKSAKFISFCAERPAFQKNQVKVHSNIFISHMRPSAAIVNHSLSATATLWANAYEGVTLGLVGRGREFARRSAGLAIANGA